MRYLQGFSAALLFMTFAASAALVELNGVAQLEAGGKHACRNGQVLPTPFHRDSRQ